MAAGNGSSHVEPPEGYYCGDGERFKRIEDEQAHLKAIDEQQEESILLLAGEVSQARKAADLVAERVGYMHPDGTATPRSLTSLVLSLTDEVTKLHHSLDRTRDSVAHIEGETEITRVQSREQLVERARKAEADARKSVPSKGSWKAEAVRVLVYLTIGGGLVTTIQQIVELFQ